MFKNTRFLLPLLLCLLLASTAGAVEVTVTVESLTPANGGVATPVWVGFHNGEFDTYDIGAPATPGLERIAEDGSPADLSAEFLASGFGTVDGVVFGPDAPVFFSGDKASATFDVDPSDASSRYFSYASMIIPSNDAFVANGNPRAHPIFDGAGNFLGADFIVAGTQVRDAGTEVNDELPANTAFFGQAAPDTGVVEGGTVQVHGGLNPVGSGGILDDPSFAAASFVRPGYQVFRIRVTAARPTTSRFYLMGDQQAPPVDSAALGVCELSLSTDGSTVDLECNHDIVDASAAHIHQAARGENGPVIFDLGDATSPIRAQWQPSAEELDALLAGELYVNVHSDTNPPGELRGQIDACFNGPVGLCLGADDRFQVTATFEDFDGNEDTATALPLSDDTGTFYFFGEDNVEVLVKVIDGCGFNDRYWVFLSGLTNLGVELTVTDTATGEVVTFDNGVGIDFEPVLDTNAFATCP